MRFLVAGGDRVDAGKTTFTTGLLDRLSAVGVKPRAGNDYWFDHDDYRRAVEDGRLYGKDAKRLAAASSEACGTDFDPEELNPVHRLWRPSPGPDTGLVGQSHREYVLDRVGESFVVNAHADVPESARRTLPLADAPVVESVERLDEITRRLHLPMLEGFAERVRELQRETGGTAVVESYGDVALPIRGLDFDAVAVVEPGRVRAYDGDRFVKACEVAGGSAREGRLEVHTGDATELADPKATAALPALSGDDRRDPAAVARAYDEAFDELLAVAES
ncbi:ATPase [Halorussus gelatinilyticus]|uniref:ATPase n=1 Tax=Halorussus gelatinilyticus TaxID=2937524 RepID=A0A8U0IH37_9EURY|nr:ATPase [Halorussus gelatinilyticus]UPW00006.1 ATPase [Halorussus gelatinilyticus]